MVKSGPGLVPLITVLSRGVQSGQMTSLVTRKIISGCEARADGMEIATRARSQRGRESMERTVSSIVSCIWSEGVLGAYGQGKKLGFEMSLTCPFEGNAMCSISSSGVPCESNRM
jgi:hypothetical protein